MSGHSPEMAVYHIFIILCVAITYYCVTIDPIF